MLTKRIGNMGAMLYCAFGSAICVSVTGSNLYRSGQIIHRRSKKELIEGVYVTELTTLSFLKGITYGSTWPTYVFWLGYKWYYCPKENVSLTYGKDDDRNIIVSKNGLNYQTYPVWSMNEKEIESN